MASGSPDAAPERLILQDQQTAEPFEDDPLPSLDQLDLRARMRFSAAVVFDYGLRTGLASAGAASAIAGWIEGSVRRDTRLLPLYAELAGDADPETVFAAPSPAQVTATPGRGPDVAGGYVELLRFESAYTPLHPDIRDEYLRHEANRVARAQHWRHRSGPRPTLVVIHGFGASPAWFNIAFFSLREVFASGWDVLLYTLPFHGARRSSTGLPNGMDLLRFGLSHLTEALLQSIHDLRVLLAHVRASGAPRIGITGLSLGGYVTALAAAIDPGLDFVVPNAAVVWMPSLLGAWFPASLTARILRALEGTSDELVERALALHSPLTYEPRLPRERLLVVAGLGDRLAPPEQSLMLWEHWGRPPLHWFPGSHVLHFGRDDYRQAVAALMGTA